MEQNWSQDIEKNPERKTNQAEEINNTIEEKGNTPQKNETEVKKGRDIPMNLDSNQQQEIPLIRTQGKVNWINLKEIMMLKQRKT